MSMLDTIKRWVVGLGPKAPPAPEPSERLQPLPNGRVAVVDAQGNFVKWVDSGT